MNLLEIKHQILDYLTNRTDFDLDIYASSENGNEYLNSDNNTRFIITNILPANSTIPYYPFDNIDDLKKLAYDVHGDLERKNIVYEIVNSYITTHNIDTNKTMYISIF